MFFFFFFIKFICSSCYLPHTAQKPQHLLKTKQTYLFTSLRSAFTIGYLSPLEDPFAEIDPERALSCPRRASYEAKVGLMLPRVLPSSACGRIER